MITYCAHEVLKIGDDLYFCSSSTTDTYQYRNESGKIGVGAPFSYVPTEKAPYVINSVHTHTHAVCIGIPMQDIICKMFNFLGVGVNHPTTCSLRPTPSAF